MKLIFPLSPESFHMEQNGTLHSIRWIKLEENDGLIEVFVKTEFDGGDYRLVLGLTPDTMDFITSMWAFKKSQEPPAPERDPELEPLRLREIISALEKCSPNLSVRFDFGGHPSTVDSYRGYYDQLALGWHGDTPTVGELLTELRSAVGGIYYGWKGGEYTMTKDTPVWAANRGESAQLGIVEVFLGTSEVILCTKQFDL